MVATGVSVGLPCRRLKFDSRAHDNGGVSRERVAFTDGIDGLQVHFGVSGQPLLHGLVRAPLQPTVADGEQAIAGSLALSDQMRADFIASQFQFVGRHAFSSESFLDGVETLEVFLDLFRAQHR